MTTVIPKYMDASLNISDESDDFNLVFERYWPQVSSILYRIVGDTALSEDLALEVFLRLFNRPHLLDQKQNVGGWLYRVATNLGLNAIRSRKRRRHYEEMAGLFEFRQINNTEPEREVEKSLERDQVRYVLANIKPRDAKLLLLRHSGFSYQEISDVIQVSPSSVGTLLARAEEAFQKVYIRMFPKDKF